MSLIRFGDKCKILRVVGTDEVWETEQTETIYDGKCKYQQGNQTSQIGNTQNGVVYLPRLVEVEINDFVEVETSTRQLFKGVVKQLRPIVFDTIHCEFTRLELIQTQNDN